MAEKDIQNWYLDKSPSSPQIVRFSEQRTFLLYQHLYFDYWPLSRDCIRRTYSNLGFSIISLAFLC